MTILRVKPTGWTLNEVLTSPQMTAVDLNVTNALDKRAGQTDTLSSAINVLGGSIGLGPASAITVFDGGIIRWSTTTDVTIGHTDNTDNGATGILTTVSGKNCTGTTSTGGDLNLTSGTGTSANGIVRIQAGGSTVMSFNNTTAVCNNRLSVIKTLNSGTVNVTTVINTVLDGTQGNHFVLSALNLNPNISIQTLTLQPGAFYTVEVVQSITGGFSPNWSSDFQFLALPSVYGSGNDGSVADLTPNHRTIWLFKSNGNKLFLLSRSNYTS